MNVAVLAAAVLVLGVCAAVFFISRNHMH